MGDETEKKNDPQRPAATPAPTPAPATDPVATVIAEVARGPLTVERILLSALLAIGGGGTFFGNTKLDTMAAAATARVDALERNTMTKLDALGGSFTRLEAKVEANEKLELDRRLRSIELLGLDRRVSSLEDDAKRGSSK